MCAALFTFVGVHSPLIMDKASDAKTKNGYSRCHCNERCENVGSNRPARDEADQTTCEAEDSNGLIKLLLRPIFEYIVRTLFCQKLSS